jgi:hypothetical protein
MNIIERSSSTNPLNDPRALTLITAVASAALTIPASTLMLPVGYEKGRNGYTHKILFEEPDPFEMLNPREWYWQGVPPREDVLPTVALLRFNTSPAVGEFEQWPATAVLVCREPRLWGFRLLVDHVRFSGSEPDRYFNVLRLFWLEHGLAQPEIEL